MKRPSYYDTPLVRKGEIIDFIFDKVYSRQYDTPHPICFDVKCRNLDLSFGNLCGYYQSNWSTDWLSEAYQKYNDAEENNGGHDEIAIEEARNVFYEKDTFKTIASWDQDIDVQYNFVGRSGGWLSIDKFEGYDFTNGASIRELPYGVLRRLYKLIVILLHDLRNPNRFVEETYAHYLFAQ